MRKPVIILLILALVVPLTSIAFAPWPPESTPVPPGSTPPIGTVRSGGNTIPNLEHLTAPSWLSGGFALQPGSDQLDQTHAFVRSLSDTQRAAIDTLLAKHPAPTPDPMLQSGQMAKSADTLQKTISTIDAAIARANLWRTEISAEMARILAPDQYGLYEASLLPLPELPAIGGIQAQSQTDCYNAFYGSYYAYLDAINFYLSSYYTVIATSDPYADGAFHVAFDAFQDCYQGVVWASDAYYHYPKSSSAALAYYYIDHAWGLLNVGYRMAYSLYTWIETTNSYNSWQNALAAFNHIDPTWDYADNCYSSSGGAVALRLDYKTFLPWVKGLAPSTILRDPVATPTPMPRRKPYSSAPDSDKSRRLQGGELQAPPDLLHLPVLPQVAGTGPALSLDETDNTRLVRQLAKSLTSAQKERMQATLASHQPLGVTSMNGDLAKAARSKTLTAQMLSNAAAEVRRQQEAISTELAGVLTPEQYQWYQQTMLPPPGSLNLAEVDAQSQSDCYYAYLNAYYANQHAWYYFQNAYYAVVHSTDNYAYDSYLFAYQSYVNSARAYQYAGNAFTSFPNSSYGDSAQYYARHANGYITWGADLARWTDSWVASSYSSNAEYYSGLAKPDIDAAVTFADSCQASSGCGSRTLGVTQHNQEQNQWCWAASSQTIMEYLGTWVSQCNQATYLKGLSSGYCCSYPSSSACNGSGASISGMSNNLAHWGFTNTWTNSSLSFTQLRGEIESNRPFNADITWTGGGGHALVVYGYDCPNSGVYWTDPWNQSWGSDGYSSYNYATYSYFLSASDHWWFASIYNIHK